MKKRSIIPCDFPVKRRCGDWTRVEEFFLAPSEAAVLGNLPLLVEGIEEGVAMEEEGEVNRKRREKALCRLAV